MAVPCYRIYIYERDFVCDEWLYVDLLEIDAVDLYRADGRPSARLLALLRSSLFRSQTDPLRKVEIIYLPNPD